MRLDKAYKMKQSELFSFLLVLLAFAIALRIIITIKLNKGGGLVLR